MDGNADVVLKETRQGKSVTSAVLDVCYPVAKGSDRKDRFVANLAVNGQTMTGTTQSLNEKVAGGGQAGAPADRGYFRIQRDRSASVRPSRKWPRRTIPI